LIRLATVLDAVRRQSPARVEEVAHTWKDDELPYAERRQLSMQWYEEIVDNWPRPVAVERS
jgi:hypothetical protein